MSRPGERGKTGDHGQPGKDGDPGARGLQGPRGRSLSLWQALAMFLLITLIGFISASRIEGQQDEINENAQRIVEAQYQSCLGGVAILTRFNMQQDSLAAIERDLLANPDATEAGKEAAAARIKAYEAARTLPLPTCVRRR